MLEGHGGRQRALKIIRMSKIAWLYPHVLVDLVADLIEINIRVGVSPNFGQSSKARVYPLILQHFVSIGMLEDAAVNDEFLVDQFEKSVISSGMGALLKEAPVRALKYILITR